ncbi:hypothetical protein PGIN_84-3_00177 [Porphyromonas gingivalis]|nr:hypothetical protein PGIN_84-3_00177 [Porphyromonas gingivalis]
MGEVECVACWLKFSNLGTVSKTKNIYFIGQR